ncbi:phage tail protein [Rheinheimera mangrovi]|uniref:phage tail protein n=1 Tax=Rheinheimera mangrovi TaxID=2498451 RepID=UPI000F8C4658|nr:tail fiber protein [Rheinheimera mangrovi]
MEPYLGEIKMFSYNWAPKGWLACNGALLPIAQNQALYSLIHTQFGGNGTTTFAVPDLRGRTPVAQELTHGVKILPGDSGGSSTITLTTAHMPAHTHQLHATELNASTKMVAGSYLAAAKLPGPNGAAVASYAAIEIADTSKNITLNTDSISVSGSAQPINNMQPSLGLNFCIATMGAYPQRN